MINLSNLKLQAVFDNQKDNVVSISSDFPGFLKNLEKTKNNLVIRILRRMCNDAKSGLRLNPNVYILNYKDMCRGFVFYIFLSAHIPFIALYLIDADFISKLIFMQSSSYVLILLLKKSTDHKTSLFCKNFYTHWYDKILNFDLIAINALKPAVLSALNTEINNNLLAAVKSFAQEDEAQFNKLAFAAQDLSLHLEKFTELQNGNGSITADKITHSLDNILKKIIELNADFDKMNGVMTTSFSNLVSISDNNKLDINAMNQNACLLRELKDAFVSYQSEALSPALAHLQKISSSLENDISKTFASIDTTISTNTEKLLSSYERFFEICETFNKSMSVYYESGNIDTLKSLNETFFDELEKIGNQNREIQIAFKSCSDSTKKLCESTYDFAQYTNSSDFMNKIRSNINFRKRLNAAQEKLVSYEKIVKLYEENSDLSAEDIKKQFYNLLNALEGDFNTRILYLENRLDALEAQATPHRQTQGPAPVAEPVEAIENPVPKINGQ
jgi:hypothetical protein